MRATAPLLRYLREVEVLARGAAADTLRALLGRCRSWLVDEHGLAAATVRRFENTAHPFVQEQASAGEVLEPLLRPGRCDSRSGAAGRVIPTG